MKRSILLCSITVLLAAVFYLLKYEPSKELLSTLYTVAGIFFSIGISLIIAFDLSPIKNNNYYNAIQANLNKLRNCYIYYFAASTLTYLIFLQAINKQDVFDLKVNILSIDLNGLILSVLLSIMLLTIAYFVVNFLEMQKLKLGITKKLREERTA